MSYAPIMIPTLCRYEHLVKCVESLAANSLASETELYIGLDYPTKESHWEGYRKIEQYLVSIEGFKKVHNVKREYNYGAERNSHELKKLIFEKYDRVIFTEDDNIFSPNFLEYINQALDKYNDDTGILAVCGYLHLADYPEMRNCTCIRLPAYDAWGYAIWRDRYEDYETDFSYETVIHTLTSFKQTIKIARKRIFTIFALLLIVNEKDVFGDTMYARKLLLENKKCIFPTISKVRNYGRDGSGTHASVEDQNAYENQRIDVCTDFALVENKDIKIQRKAERALKSYYRQPLKRIYWIVTRYLLFRIRYVLNKRRYEIK